MTAFEQFLNDNQIKFLKNEPMSRHTSFHIGGAAEHFVMPADASELLNVIKYCNTAAIPVTIVGKGSNLVVSDNGIAGAVICTLGINDIYLCENGNIFAAAGASLAALCTFAKDNCLSGLEFAYGIPGSVGGAMFMNAGAYGGEMKDVAVSACVMDSDFNCYIVEGADMELSYRSSLFKKKGLTVLGAYFRLKKDNKDDIIARMEDYMGRRKSKQPLEYPSAGSVFKRPQGYFAGALVEKNGFKGFCVGGAQVSEKHAGFIINTGNATCSDVKTLVEIIQKKVLAEDGVALETELIFTDK